MWRRGTCRLLEARGTVDAGINRTLGRLSSPRYLGLGELPSKGPSNSAFEMQELGMKGSRPAAPLSGDKGDGEGGFLAGAGCTG